MGNSANKRKVAVQHNKERAERIALELDRKENPEKYKRHGSTAKQLRLARLLTAIGLSATAFDNRLLK